MDCLDFHYTVDVPPWSFMAEAKGQFSLVLVRAAGDYNTDVIKFN